VRRGSVKRQPLGGQGINTKLVRETELSRQDIAQELKAFLAGSSPGGQVEGGGKWGRDKAVGA